MSDDNISHQKSGGLLGITDTALSKFTHKIQSLQALQIALKKGLIKVTADIESGEDNDIPEVDDYDLLEQTGNKKHSPSNIRKIQKSKNGKY